MRSIPAPLAGLRRSGSVPRAGTLRTGTLRNGTLRNALLAGALVLVATACDTGDGRTLRSPTEPAPPPPTTAPPLTDGGSLPEEPLDGTDQLRFEVFAAWRDGAAIDTRHTCDGDDISPALTWTAVPDGTAELAITVVDENAEGFVHWIVIGIDPSTVSSFEGLIPPEAAELTNSFGDVGWGGPCPPPGSTHVYRFSIHALNQQVELADDTPADEAVALIDQLTFESATITGTFTR
jgi:Raf kinase inhibitor-like YbhB/YbcL family protein